MDRKQKRWKRRTYMIQLFDSGAYLINGTEMIPDNAQSKELIKNKIGRDIGKEEAKKRLLLIEF